MNTTISNSTSTVEIITSKGCSKLFITRPPFCRIGSTEMMMSSASASSSVLLSPSVTHIDGPFSGLVICVTGLSKEARNQVMAATERLGGQYSPSLHPKCTHLVVQSFGGKKFEHAIKHGARKGLFVVTLGWFVDSVKRNMRLSESLYTVRNIGENGTPLGELNRIAGPPVSERSCIPVLPVEDSRSPKKELESIQSVFADQGFYVDPDISSDTRKKIVGTVSKEGGKLLDHWFIGCNASYVICEGNSLQRYISHSKNLVTPLWLLKTVKERSFQRIVHISSDLAKHVAIVLEHSRLSEEITKDRIVSPAFERTQFSPISRTSKSIEERQKIADVAKHGVRDRRSRRMQICQVPIQPITPTGILDSVCWTISDPTSTASVYTDSSCSDEANETLTESKKEPDLSADNLTRPLKDSEKREVVFKNHFITVLFPIDRFGELGPSSRTFFSNGGITCIQLLDHIYNFYQENMSENEIEVAIHTDSRHADRLRSIYASNESIKQGFVAFKRIDFMGSRRSFESLKRLSGETNSNVYQLLVRA